MNTIKVTAAANITYSGNTFNTPLLIEYRHTGKIFYKNKTKRHSTSSSETAQRWKSEGKKVVEVEGYYFIDRIAIPTINARGEKAYWYITNDGDSYKVNKVSKYGKKIHEQLSNNINPFKN